MHPEATGGLVVKPRELVFEVFGDHVRYRGGEVRLHALSELLACFGVPAGTVRVVVTRMRREGWLDSRREGRETVYSVTPAGLRLLDERRSRLFERAARPWDGHWHMAVYQVPESERTLREHLRQDLTRLGFGPISPAVWVCPHDRLDRVRAAAAEHPAIRLDAFQARSEGTAADHDLADRAWDLRGLGEEYSGFLDRWQPSVRRWHATPPDGREALRARAALIHDYRPIAFRDPDLPAELLPSPWPGREAHALFLEALDLLAAPASATADDILGLGD